MGALGSPQTPRRSSLIAHSFTSSYAPVNTVYCLCQNSFTVSIQYIVYVRIHLQYQYSILFMSEVFFKGVHLECEKNPIHIIHFIGYLSAKYLPLFFN